MNLLSHKTKIFSLVIALLCILFIPTISVGKVFYLDSQLSQNCRGNYSIVNRDCSGNDGDAYNNLEDAINNLAGGDTLYIRSGTYSRPPTNDGSEGTLHITASGTADRHTVVSAYNNELVIIQARPGCNNYNPDPGDTSFTNSSHYYPNPAIIIQGSYIDVRGLKTYGQVVIHGHDITLENCDLGGGGPHIHQGQVVFLVGYNLVVRNNKIHHSCWGESDANGAALMGYDFSGIIENNEFYDNWGPDIRIKDTGGQAGRATVIRYNFFGPSSLRDNEGIQGIGQDREISYVYIHNNIFYNKRKGIEWDMSAVVETVAYNNIFVNCDIDISCWMRERINVYNNIYYHSNSGQAYYEVQAEPLSLLNSDYNLFYSANGDTQWRNLWRPRATTLSEWQNYSSKDLNSISENPLFVNPEAGDFHLRENSPCRNTGKDGVNMGCYITGNEIIGPILNQGPQVSNESPARNATDVPRNTNISFDITDSDGVNQSSISVSVNGNNVTSSCTITAISNGFHVLYDPPQDFDYRQDVTVLVTATDGLGNTTNDSWSFKIKQLSDVIGFDASLNESSVKLTWEVPDDPDYAGVEIRCFSSPDHNYEVYPANHTEGTFVCRVNKPGESCIHNDVIENHRYNYSAFSYDAQSNYTETVHTHVIVDVSPVISEVDSQPSTNSAVITWTTNEPATSQVEYGLNTDYGSLTDLDSNLVTSHSVTITGLVPETLYHYRVRSQDANGNEAISIDHTFTTHPLEPGTYTVILGDTPDSDYPGTLEDTFININEENNSNSQYLNTYTWPENSIANAIIMKWDLSNIPSSATIHNATLYLYLSDMEGDGGDDLYDLSVHKIINYNPVISACNGYTYDGINPWTPYSGLYNDIPLAQADIAEAEDTKSIDKTYGYKSWSVTNMVQEWVSNPDSNYGMLVNSDPVASQDSNRYFSSTESPNPDQRPKLVITYTISNAEPDITPPGEVSSFSVTPGNGQITLSWVNPTDDDFTGTMIRYRTDTYPTNFSDGILVCNKTASPGCSDSFIHTGLQNGTTYYYSAFTYDEVPNYSEGVHISATPTEPSPPPDTTNPTVTITQPTSADTYSTQNSSITLGGTASDNVGVTSITWENNRGGNGTASGTDNWSIPNISLQEGENVITVTAHDEAGNTATDSITVTYTNPLAITTESPLPDAMEGEEYHIQLKATGGSE